MDRLPDELVDLILCHCGPTELIAMAHVSAYMCTLATRHVRRELAAPLASARAKSITRIKAYVARHLPPEWISWAAIECGMQMKMTRRTPVRVRHPAFGAQQCMFSYNGMPAVSVATDSILDMCWVWQCGRANADDRAHICTVDAVRGFGMMEDRCEQCRCKRLRLVDPCKCFEWQLAPPGRRIVCCELPDKEMEAIVAHLTRECCSLFCASDWIRSRGAREAAAHFQHYVYMFDSFECKLFISHSHDTARYRAAAMRARVSFMLALGELYLDVAKFQQEILEQDANDETDDVVGGVEDESEIGLHAWAGLSCDQAIEDVE